MSPAMHIGRRINTGFSLLEILIALALSAVLLAGVATMFASTRSSYQTNERLAEVEENGQFAIDLISREIRASGYIGCNKKVKRWTALNAAANAIGDYLNPVGGYEYQSPGTWAPLGVTGDTVSAADKSDVLLVRTPESGGLNLTITGFMASPTDDLKIQTFAPPAVGPFKKNQILFISNCSNAAIFQITDYDPATGVIQHHVQDADDKGPGNATDSLGSQFGGTIPGITMRNTSYFIRDSATPGRGTSLWRKINSQVDEVVEGIETFQVLYGINTNGLVPRSVDSYVTANNVTDWSRVMSVSVALIARSIDEYGDQKDSGSYILFDTTAPKTTFTAPGDRRLRKVFATTVSIRNQTW